jgi:ribosome-binding ATPase YchF (GTP1/OBG family)
MKICLFGIPRVPLGKHNLKDARLDQVHQLVEAAKKACAQVELLSEDGAQEAAVIAATPESYPDLILKDLEFVETRLGRNPPEAERLVLEKINRQLEQEKTVYQAGLSEQDKEAVAAHGFLTDKPILVASKEELDAPDNLILRAFQESGYICFLTVGGKENRAWPIPRGTTAWQAAGTIHSDLQRGFIRAEIIGFDDFLEAGGETQAKRAGKQRLETKDYVMRDYDLVNFRFSK